MTPTISCRGRGSARCSGTFSLALLDGVSVAPALEVIRRYDTEDTLFYLDPPYVHSSRGDVAAYAHEMADGDHAELAEAIKGIRGRAVLSGYRTSLYDRLYSDWERVDAPQKVVHSVRQTRQESLWLNFEPCLKA